MFPHYSPPELYGGDGYTFSRGGKTFALSRPGDHKSTASIYI
jgi:hypothetical protein